MQRDPQRIKAEVMPRTILSKVPVLGFPEPPYKLGNPELSLRLHRESPRALVNEKCAHRVTSPRTTRICVVHLYLLTSLFPITFHSETTCRKTTLL